MFYRLSRGRRVIENTFGILTAKWRVFRKPIIAKLCTVEKIIQATVCLHNFLRKRDIKKIDVNQYCPSNFVDRENENGEIIGGNWRSLEEGNNFRSVRQMGGNAYGRNAANVRKLLTEYFMYENPIEPQWSK